MLQKYQQVPATSGQTNINYKKATHTTKDLQTREVLQEKKYNGKKKQKQNSIIYHKLSSFLQPFSLHSLVAAVKKIFTSGN